MSLSKELAQTDSVTTTTTETTTFVKEEVLRSNDIKVSVQPPEKVIAVAEVTIPITNEKEKEFLEKK